VALPDTGIFVGRQVKSVWFDVWRMRLPYTSIFKRGIAGNGTDQVNLPSAVDQRRVSGSNRFRIWRTEVLFVVKEKDSMSGISSGVGISLGPLVDGYHFVVLSPVVSRV
jgi:hypothetical protein